MCRQPTLIPGPLSGAYKSAVTLSHHLHEISLPPVFSYSTSVQEYCFKFYERQLKSLSLMSFR